MDALNLKMDDFQSNSNELSLENSVYWILFTNDDCKTLIETVEPLLTHKNAEVAQRAARILNHLQNIRSDIIKPDNRPAVEDSCRLEANVASYWAKNNTVLLLSIMKSFWSVVSYLFALLLFVCANCICFLWLLSFFLFLSIFGCILYILWFTVASMYNNISVVSGYTIYEKVSFKKKWSSLCQFYL